MYPSNDAIDVCNTCEKFMREVLSCNKTLGTVDLHKLVSSVLEAYRGKNVFSDFSYHMYDTQPLDNHLHLLIKAIAERYFQVRYHYASKQITAKLKSKVKIQSRQIYTKLIHFSGQ